VARALAAQGRQVRGLVRTTSPRANLENFPGELVEGDLRNVRDVRRAMKGVRHLFHVAADYRLWSRDPAELAWGNHDMTQLVMEAALEVGVERIVYTSSVATLRPRHDRPADETDAADVTQAVGYYKRGKVVAEQTVSAMASGHGLPAVIVLPSTPIGPRDVKPTPTGRIIVEAANGKMPAFVDSGLNLVHVDDVAAGHLLAFEKGKVGERYILGGQDVMLGTMLADIAEIVGRRPPTVRIPRAPLFPLAWLNEQRARLFGGNPFLTVDSLRMAAHHMFFTSAKAEAELGYRARPYREALVDAVDWFRGAGMIR
jgi:dihydroflavonol-4-reductase